MLQLAKPRQPPPRPSQFVFARDRGGRAKDINDFYNSFTGRNRSFDAYRWEFHTGPSGPALVWTITETLTRRVVGHHSIIPIPLVRHGLTIEGGRTENTIIDPDVRHKVFYPAMEKKALAETLQTLRIIYTIHSMGPGPLRKRLGYKAAGRWVVYLPKVGSGYLLALFRRACATLGLRVPYALLKLAAAMLGRLHGLRVMFRSHAAPLEVTEIDDVAGLAEEYLEFWRRARDHYDMTIDRSLNFLRWRITANPHLRFRTWTARKNGQLQAVLIGHKHTLGTVAALYIDDIIVGEYDDASFEAVLSSLPELDPTADAIVLITLAVNTPLHRVLLRRFPLQSLLLKRFGHRLFDEMLAFDKEGVACGEPWYVTPVFTEGLDTSRWI